MTSSYESSLSSDSSAKSEPQASPPAPATLNDEPTGRSSNQDLRRQTETQPEPSPPPALTQGTQRMQAPPTQTAHPPTPAGGSGAGAANGTFGSFPHQPTASHPLPPPQQQQQQQNRLSPYIRGATRERTSSSSSLDRRAVAAAPSMGGPTAVYTRDRSRSFGHSHSSPIPSPLAAGGYGRFGSGATGGGGGGGAGGGGGGAMMMPMIPNLTAQGQQHPPPLTPPCTPVGSATKISATSAMGPSAMAVPVSPSVMRARQKAMEHALEAERARAKDLEEKEKGMEADQLRVHLKRERAHSAKLAADLAGMWSAAGLSQAEAEVYEEGRINQLMRRLDRLQREKGRIIIELEREEEMLTNTLQKKLNEVRREKALLEKQIQREHEENARLKRLQEGQQQAKNESEG